MEILKSFKGLKDGTVLKFRPDADKANVRAGWGLIREQYTKVIYKKKFDCNWKGEFSDGNWWFSPDMFLKPKNTIWI